MNAVLNKCGEVIYRQYIKSTTIDSNIIKYTVKALNGSLLAALTHVLVLYLWVSLNYFEK